MNTIFYPSWLYRHRILVAIIISVTGLAYLLLKSLLFRQITEPLLQWVIEGMVVCVIAPALIWQGLEWGNKLFQDYKQAQQKFQALEGVYATALDIISQLDLEQVLDSIVSRCAILVGAYSGYLTLYDKDKDLVRVVSTYPPQQEDIGREIQRGRGLSGEVIETGQIKIINDYLKWSNRVEQSGRGPYFDSAIGIPLQWQGQVIGALVLGHWSKYKKFSDTDAWLLRPFAGLASIALKNAIAYKRELDLSLELTQRDVQKTVQLDQTREELLQRNTQLQSLIGRMAQIQELERSRIATDMYESTTQLVLGALYTTQAAIDGVSSDNPPSALKNMQIVQDFLYKIDRDINRSIQNLRPQILDDQGFLQAVKLHAERYSKINRKPCNIRVEGTYARLPDYVELAIYRIIQEVLQNAAVNNPASQINIDFFCDPQLLQVVIQDEGKGYDLSQDVLSDYDRRVGMSERAESIGAHLKISSEPGQGTRMELIVPTSAGETKNVERIRVLIVDAHQFFRYGLASLLSQDPAIEVVGEAEDINDALEVIDRVQPEVVLLDIRIHGLGGTRPAQKILQKEPGIKIILLTDMEDEDFLMDALTSGVYGYLFKSHSSKILLSAIHKVHAGEKLLDAKLTNRILNELSEQAQKKKQNQNELTDQELQVLYHLSQGENYEEIGKYLFVSEPTIKRMVNSVQAKLGTNNRTQAVAEAIRNGMI